MPKLELRPRSGTEIVDAAFQLYRLYFVPLVAVTAVAFAPVVIVSLVLTGGDPELTARYLGIMATIMLLGWVTGSFSEAVVVLAVSDGYVSGSVDVGAVIRRALPRLGAIVASSFLKWMLIGLAFLAGALAGGLIVLLIGVALSLAVNTAPSPTATIVLGFIVTAILCTGGAITGSWLFGAYFAVPATVVIEGLGPVQGLRRSNALSKGVKFKAIMVLGTAMSLLAILQFVVSALTQALPGPMAVGFALQQAVYIVLYPIISVIAALLYYDARIRGEGFDIEMMVAELGPAPTVS